MVNAAKNAVDAVKKTPTTVASTTTTTASIPNAFIPKGFTATSNPVMRDFFYK
jgi:hypothetical protein